MTLHSTPDRLCLGEQVEGGVFVLPRVVGPIREAGAEVGGGRVAAARLDIETQVHNGRDEPAAFDLGSVVTAFGGHPAGALGTVTSRRVSVAARSSVTLLQRLNLSSATRLWHVDQPTHRYVLTSTLLDAQGARVIDAIETTFGVRTAQFDATRGFALNGESLKVAASHAASTSRPARRVARLTPATLLLLTCPPPPLAVMRALA